MQRGRRHGRRPTPGSTGRRPSCSRSRSPARRRSPPAGGCDSERPVRQDEAVRLLESLLWRGISNFPRQERARRVAAARVRCRRTRSLRRPRVRAARLASRARPAWSTVRSTTAGGRRWRSRSACCTRRARSCWRARRPRTRSRQLVAAALKSVDGQLILTDEQGPQGDRAGQPRRLRRDRPGRTDAASASPAEA